MFSSPAGSLREGEGKLDRNRARLHWWNWAAPTWREHPVCGARPRAVSGGHGNPFVALAASGIIAPWVFGGPTNRDASDLCGKRAPDLPEDATVIM